MLQNVYPSHLRLLQPRTVLVWLLLSSADWRAGLPSLQPPWLQVFPEDDVTLSCQGAPSPGDNSTQWFHNGTTIPTQAQPSYSFKASSSHSGDYRCQTGQTSLSDPVHLDVTSAWLLLQTGGPHRAAVPQLEELAPVHDHILSGWETQVVFPYEFQLLHPTCKRQPQWRVPLLRVPRSDAARIAACEHHCPRWELQILEGWGGQGPLSTGAPLNGPQRDLRVLVAPAGWMDMKLV